MKAIATSRAPEAIGPYSQAVMVGDMLFCSGQLGIDPGTGKLVGNDTGSQAKQALINLTAVLEAASLRIEDVVKTTVYVTDMTEFGKVNDIYAETFAGHKPARACVEVSNLPKDARVEIECIAMRASS